MMFVHVPSCTSEAINTVAITMKLSFILRPEIVRPVTQTSHQTFTAQCHGLQVFDRLWIVPVLVTAGSPLPAGMPECGVSRRAAGSTVRRGSCSGGFAVLLLVRPGCWPW